MGLHTGIASAADVAFNPTTSHMAYGGTAMKVAKAVGDAAGGGMVSGGGARYSSTLVY